MSAPLVHLVFESAAYAVGFAVFRRLRRRHGHPSDHPSGGWIFVGAVLGAAFGAKLLAFVQYGSTAAEAFVPLLGRGDEAPPQRPPDVAALLGGKTIVGGLVGGWIGVAIAKRGVGIARSTGDLLVPALVVGLLVGRLGCLLAGAGDRTAGHLAAVPWAIDLGDGPRHPTLLYEALALLALGALDRLPARRDGDRFLRFIAGYLGFRFVVDYWKAPWGPDPVPPTPDVYLGVTTPIQAVALAGACYALARLARRA